LKRPLIRHGLRPRHLLPQGEKEESSASRTIPLERDQPISDSIFKQPELSLRAKQTIEQQEKLDCSSLRSSQ
jgi:hypothetical protein